MNKNYLILLLACFCQVLLTMVPLGIKATIADIWTIGIARLVVCVLIMVVFFGKNYFYHLKKLWPLGFFFFLHWSTYAQSVKVSTPSTAIIGLSFYGIFLLIYSQYFLKKSISLFVYFLISVATLTVFFTFSKGDELEGILWGLTSAAAYAALPIINIKNKNFPHGVRAFIQFSACLFFYLIIGLPQSNWNLPLHDYFILLALGIGGTVIGHGLWVKVTTELPTEVTSGVYYLVIPFSFFLEKIFLDIPLNKSKILGSILIIFCNLLIILITKKQSQKKKSPVL